MAVPSLFQDLWRIFALQGARRQAAGSGIRVARIGFTGHADRFTGLGAPHH